MSIYASQLNLIYLFFGSEVPVVDVQDVPVGGVPVVPGVQVVPEVPVVPDLPIVPLPAEPLVPVVPVPSEPLVPVVPVQPEEPEVLVPVVTLVPAVPEVPEMFPFGVCPDEDLLEPTYLADMKNCSVFYQCVHGVPYRLECRLPLEFNPVLNVCDFPYRSGCLFSKYLLFIIKKEN